ncbi:SIS domain-containing protein [Ktedonosporobacter rubrisoli]|uniref:SIS domain-containing protein n=1 Tax=Ktedonosporobacter rubrisoli TaxID=2509675 RepID=A0A4P6JPI5_KTERU|nr:SIS domain-containing protein [Ktedonosporobacter rubrisoli]QBD76992.1 SIS domain-containing protein [Ktedonosporobacter rubrisoli]
MLQLDKSQVDFLVTSSMVGEVEAFLRNGKEVIADIVAQLVAGAVDKFYFVGCGSSMAVGDAAKYLLDKYSTVAAHVYTGWEFVDHTPLAVDDKAAVIVISHSGTTEEVVKALRKANERGAITISIVNERTGNPLGEEGKFALAYNAHAMWECHLLGVYLLACYYIQQTKPLAVVEHILADLEKLPGVLDYHISHYEEIAARQASQVSSWKGFYTVAAGPLVSLAYKEGVITNMEFMWGHGAVIESGEFRHGPLEIVDKGVPFVFLLGTDESRHITERALRFVRKHGGDAIVFDYQELSQGLHPDLAPMVMFVPLEWFSYYFAIAHGHNPDDRRYYGIVEY